MRFLSLLLPGSLAAQNGISLNTDSIAASFYGMTEDIYIDEHLLENDDDNSQAISILNGAANNVYYNTASYNFGPMHFKYRGYSSPYTAVYVNGIEMNDLITGSFDYTSLGGMTSRAFRNKTTVVGMDAATYGFGAIGGATNYNTSAMGYAPGFAGSLAFTNSSYMLCTVGRVCGDSVELVSTACLGIINCACRPVDGKIDIVEHIDRIEIILYTIVPGKQTEPDAYYAHQYTADTGQTHSVDKLA